MDIPAALLNQLAQLADGIGLDAKILQLPLTNLSAALQALVPSCRVLHVDIVHNGQPITLTHVLLPETDGAVSTSLRVSLSLLSPDYHWRSRVVFYAARPGAFVDLAADLGYVMETSVATVGPDRDRADSDLEGPMAPRLILDADLPPRVDASGLTGLCELSAVNRAVGVLIERGHDPGDAYDSLRQAAAEAGVEVHVYAARMLGR